MNVASDVAATDICSKSEFARRRGVTPGRVTQWITEGKIGGEALVGEGRSAQIRESVAVSQLKTRLNIDQRIANGLGTRLTIEVPAPVKQADAASAVVPPPPAGDPIEEQIKRARLAGIEFDNRKKAEEEAARSGRLTDAEGARAEMGKLAVQLVTTFEGALAEFASSIAAKWQIPQRDVLHHLRGEFRKVRESAAALVRQQAAEVPALIAREIDDPA